MQFKLYKCHLKEFQLDHTFICLLVELMAYKMAVTNRTLLLWNAMVWYNHKVKCLSSKEDKTIHEMYRNLTETLIIRVSYWRTVDVLCVDIFL